MSKSTSPADVLSTRNPSALEVNAAPGPRARTAIDPPSAKVMIATLAGRGEENTIEK